MADSEHMTNQLEIKVALMEQNMNNFKNVFARLDMAIEKIGDVSGVIKQMLAVHEQRISNLDDRINYHKNDAEMANESIKRDVKDLNTRITDVNKEFTALLTSTETKILEKQDEVEERILASMKDMKESLVKSNKSLESRVKTLETWRWILVGMGTAVGLLLEYVYDALTKS